METAHYSLNTQEFIKALRLIKGLTIEEQARLIGISFNIYYIIEAKGVRTIKQLEILSKAFDKECMDIIIEKIRGSHSGRKVPNTPKVSKKTLPFGFLLRDYRKSEFRGSMAEMGRLVGASRQSIEQYELGIYVPDYSLLTTLKCDIDLKVAWLKAVLRLPLDCIIDPVDVSYLFKEE